MGVYFYVVNNTKREAIRSPFAAKEFEWNGPGAPNSAVVLWALFHRWSGDHVEVLNDAGGCDDHPYFKTGRWPNVWDEVRCDYEKALTHKYGEHQGKHIGKPGVPMRYDLEQGWVEA